MTRVTDYFNLGATQGGVDFVDVDVHGDVPVYIDPTALKSQSGDWTEACMASLRSFFHSLLSAIKSGDGKRQRELVYPLTEPNETHLGVSVGESRGRGLGGRKRADVLLDSLRGSRALASGFLEDLEDTALMVDGIDKDIVSDIATCVIRQHLIEYTQQQCEFHEIPTELQESGSVWDDATKKWNEGLVLLPRAAGDKLVLVPKSIVRAKLTVDRGRYYRGYLRPYFEADVLANPRAGLVRILKSGELRVNRKKLDEELGTTKPAIIRNTGKHPEALTKYRDRLASEDKGPLSEEGLAERIGGEVENLRQVLAEIRAVSPGTDGANPYHRAVAKLLRGLFSQSLGNERIEAALHGGMKRIDITYDNVAKSGFFNWLGMHYPAASLVVECKNYGKDAVNPEFDQIAMRFSRDRGQVGILACRAFEDKEKALHRARAITTDGHGYVLVLDDDDFERLVDDYEEAGESLRERVRYPLLKERFQALLGG